MQIFIHITSTVVYDEIRNGLQTRHMVLPSAEKISFTIVRLGFLSKTVIGRHFVTSTQHSSVEVLHEQLCVRKGRGSGAAISSGLQVTAIDISSGLLRLTGKCTT